MRQYAGNPDLFPVSFGIVHDGDDDIALNRNVSAEALGDRTAWAFARIMAASVRNWPFRTSTPGGAAMSTAPIYSRSRDVWIAAAFTELTPFYWSHDCGVTWLQLGAFLGSGTCIALGAHPTTARIVAFMRSGLATYNDAFDGAWLGTGNHTMGQDAKVDRIHWFSPGNLFVAVGGTPSPAKAHIATSTDGATWTARDDKIPAALAQDASWATAAGRTRILACSRATGRTTHMASRDGLTWQAISIPVDADEILQDIAYDAYSEEFLALLFKSSPVSVRFIATRDEGATWETRSSIAEWVTGQIAPCNGAWVALAQLRAQSSTIHIRYSLDGGRTWRVGTGSLSGTREAERYLLGSSGSGSQCMATDGVTVITSQSLGL